MYSADDIINKTLYAEKTVVIHNLPDQNSDMIYTLLAGEMVGEVYSWVLDGRGQLWWMIWDGNNVTGYARHEQGRYSVEALEQQGVKTVLEKIEEQRRENLTWQQKIYEDLAETFGLTAKTIKYGVPILIASVIGFKIYQTTKK